MHFFQRFCHLQLGSQDTLHGTFNKGDDERGNLHPQLLPTGSLFFYTFPLMLFSLKCSLPVIDSTACAWNSHVDAPTLQGNSIRRRGECLWEWPGLDEVLRGGWHDGIGALIRRHQRDPLHVPGYEHMVRRWQSVTQGRALTRRWLCWHPDLELLDPELWKNTFLWFKHPPAYGFCYGSPGLTCCR